MPLPLLLAGLGPLIGKALLGAGASAGARYLANKAFGGGNQSQSNNQMRSGQQLGSGLQQINRLNPQQQQAQQFALGSSLQGLQNPTQGFAPIAQRARSNFQQQTVPGLAERFTSMGQNSLSSPAFASQLGAAGAGLDEGLAAQESQYGLQNRSQLMQLLGMGLQPQQENIYVPEQQNALQQGLSQFAGPGMLALLKYYLSQQGGQQNQQEQTSSDINTNTGGGQFGQNSVINSFLGR